jgi:hypothetical protein
MNSGVACSAEGNEILGTIIAGSAAKSFVVNLKIGHHAAELASPAVAAEHLVAKLLIEF